MTSLSIVVPAYRVREYLLECLDSISAQEYSEFEVIAVDDCCPDGCGEILDAYAAEDPRIRVLHLKENVGLGLARQAGIAVARGDYILFVDGDDLLALGALAAISARIEATNGPDVLVFDFANYYSEGHISANPRSRLLRETGPRTFHLDDRPDLLWLLMSVWNKAYRRDFVERRQLRFRQGYYEDIPWSYPALLLAERIAVLDFACLYYRQRRKGSILQTRSRRHFEVFDQYDRLFAFLDSHPELAHWRPRVFERMLDQIHTILSEPGRLPGSARASFFRKAAKYYRRYLPTDLRSIPGRRGLRHHLISRNAYLTYETMLLLATSQRAMSSLISRSGPDIRQAPHHFVGPRRSTSEAPSNAGNLVPHMSEDAVSNPYSDPFFEPMPGPVSNPCRDSASSTDTSSVPGARIPASKPFRSS
jgi:glycosyltransferase involved in cell wall biosynthesis